jgi:hypothetical protein
MTVFGFQFDPQRAGLYIALLSIGSMLLTLAIVGTALYLTLSIKAINLSRRQSNFIDSVTHELKSPIASLKANAQPPTDHRGGAGGFLQGHAGRR